MKTKLRMHSTRRQLTVDRKTYLQIEQLSLAEGRSRDAVLRDLLKTYALLDTRLNAIEANPGFRDLMERSERDFRSGRVVTHTQVRRRFRKPE